MFQIWYLNIPLSLTMCVWWGEPGPGGCWDSKSSPLCTLQLWGLRCWCVVSEKQLSVLLNRVGLFWGGSSVRSWTNCSILLDAGYIKCFARKQQVMLFPYRCSISGGTWYGLVPSLWCAFLTIVKDVSAKWIHCTATVFPCETSKYLWRDT